MKKAVAVGGGKVGGGGTAPTDLLVCFPARARQHLALMPKPICSPSRTTIDKAAAARRRQLQLQLPGGGSVRGGSPMFRRSSRAAEDDEEEPQSPKVTCAGQIKAGGRGRPKKVKPGPGSPAAAAAARHGGKDGDGGGARSWITVVEEIERLHGRGRSKKAGGWLDALGIRRDALPFLGAALRSLRFKAPRCFGSLHGAAAAAEVSTESDGDGDGERGGETGDGGRGAAASVFSKWFMVLEGGGQEPLDGRDEECGQEEDVERQRAEERDESADGPAAPPPNALLLMRCRSAPAKGLSVSRRGGTCELLASEVEPEKGTADAVQGQGQGQGDGEAEDREELVFMSTAPGFLKLSLDIAKETWVIGGGGSRSCKR